VNDYIQQHAPSTANTSGADPSFSLLQALEEDLGERIEYQYRNKRVRSEKNNAHMGSALGK
jgi:hypothetical protein